MFSQFSEMDQGLDNKLSMMEHSKLIVICPSGCDCYSEQFEQLHATSYHHCMGIRVALQDLAKIDFPQLYLTCSSFKQVNYVQEMVVLKLKIVR